MQQMSSASGDVTAPISKKRGVLAGLIAGTIALGCCVGPAVAVLLGLTSAAVAIDLATDLFNEWGWAFKLAGLAFAAIAARVTIKQARSCSIAKPRLGRFLGIVALVGLATYALLYAGTTWLGNQAGPSASRIVAEGDSIDERVGSAIEQTLQRYPKAVINLEGLSSTGVRLRTGWKQPDKANALSEDYSEEIAARVRDSREATIILLQAIARSVPQMEDFSAYDDKIFIPIWSRNQILAVDAIELRDFQTYSSFVSSAADQAGYSILFQGTG